MFKYISQQPSKGELMKKHLQETRKEKQERDTKRRISSSLKEALVRIDELEEHVEAVKRLKKAHSNIVIVPSLAEGKSEAVAFAIATDWHLGSIVSKSMVNGLNEYNLTIAKKRITNFFEGVVSLTEKERQNVSITELVLFLGGDLIDGALHLDTIMSNDIAQPIEQAVICQGLVEAGLNFLLNHGKFKKITVVGVDGNHGRVTQKMHWTSRQGNSLEWYMLYNIATRFPQLQWQMVHGLHEYVTVYDKVIRFHHGDTIGFGGINGPYTFLNRKIGEWDKAIRADMSVQGHLHSYIPGSRRWLINGSLIGYSSYAQALGGEAQPPIQAFFLIDKKRGLTVQIPILV